MSNNYPTYCFHDRNLEPYVIEEFDSDALPNTDNMLLYRADITMREYKITYSRGSYYFIEVNNNYPLAGGSGTTYDIYQISEDYLLSCIHNDYTFGTIEAKIHSWVNFGNSMSIIHAPRRPAQCRIHPVRLEGDRLYIPANVKFLKNINVNEVKLLIRANRFTMWPVKEKVRELLIDQILS
jgi:hypothetical protein